MTLSPLSFCKRYRSSYETPSSSASPASSLTLPLRKRYRGTSEPILNTETEGDESEAEGISSNNEELEEEGLGLKRYGAARHRALKLAEGTSHSTYEVGQSSRSVPVQQTVDETTTPRLPVCTTWEDLVDGTVYTDIECVMPPVRALVQTLASPEWSSCSLPVSPASLTVPSPVATPALVEPVDEGYLAEIGAQLKLHGGVRDEIHSQRLEMRFTINFGALWRLVLALEAWACHSDAKRALM
ncbi:hypothetical protein Tco_1433336 [Tanacetum coccineum]